MCLCPQCPCTSNFGGDPIFYPKAKTKIQKGGVNMLPSGSCAEGSAATTAEECFEGAATIGVNASSFTNKTVSDASLPYGCSVVSGVGGGTAATYFNTAGDKAGCKAQKSKLAGVKSAIGVSVNVHLALSPGGAVNMTRSSKVSE